MNLQEYIKTRLKELNWTQSELAKQVGVSRVVITQLLNGERAVSFRKLFNVIGKPDYLTDRIEPTVYASGSTLDYLNPKEGE